MGGGMATHGIQLGIAMGDPTNYPFELSLPLSLLKFALSLQNSTSGAFVEPKDEGRSIPPLGSMTLDGIFQIVRSSEQLARHGDSSWTSTARASCDLLLATSAVQLNDKALTLTHYGK